MERDRVFGQDHAQSNTRGEFKLLERPLARPGRRAAHFRRQGAQNEKGQAPPDLHGAPRNQMTSKKDAPGMHETPFSCA